MAKVKLPIKKHHLSESAAMLSQLLSDSYVLYVKTHNFHWNVVDPRFDSLHKMFQSQYEELAEAVDVIAEQIRALQHIAPGTMAEFLKFTGLKEGGKELSGDGMLKALLLDHEAIASYLPKMIERCTQQGDHATADLMIDRLRLHEKTSWMLRSHFA